MIWNGQNNLACLKMSIFYNEQMEFNMLTQILSLPPLSPLFPHPFTTSPTNTDARINRSHHQPCLKPPYSSPPGSDWSLTLLWTTRLCVINTHRPPLSTPPQGPPEKEPVHPDHCCPQCQEMLGKFNKYLPSELGNTYHINTHLAFLT